MASGEWRLENGRPYAAILRWFIENTDDNGEQSKAVEGQVLVVSKVADGYNEILGSCVVGYIDARANAKANDIAQEVADNLARNFTCINDRPSYYGTRGKYSGDPVSNFE